MFQVFINTFIYGSLYFRVNILVDFLNPRIKVIGCQYVCLCVTKDLASRLTDMVLLSNAVSHTPRDLNYFGGGYHHPFKRNHP